MSATPATRSVRQQPPQGDVTPCSHVSIDELVAYAMRRARHQSVPSRCVICGARLPKIPLGLFRQIAVSD